MRAPACLFDRVAFDVDSTLSSIEGIDELARLRRADVAALTARAMQGGIRLEDIYGKRLAIVRPDVRMVSIVAALYVEHVVTGARTLIQQLQKSGVEVYVVSGALRPTILPLARYLNIPGSRVLAVDMYFDARGRFAGFDENSPLTTATGKRTVFEDLRSAGRKVAFIGDGATDLAAAPVVDRFIAFTGVADRPQVSRAARFRAHTFSAVRKILSN